MTTRLKAKPSVAAAVHRMGRSPGAQARRFFVDDYLCAHFLVHVLEPLRGSNAMISGALPWPKRRRPRANVTAREAERALADGGVRGGQGRSSPRGRAARTGARSACASRL